MNLSRFRLPNRNDEMAECVFCGRIFHYTALDDLGYCGTCKPDDEDEEPATEPESHAGEAQ